MFQEPDRPSPTPSRPSSRPIAVRPFCPVRVLEPQTVRPCNLIPGLYHFGIRAQSSYTFGCILSFLLLLFAWFILLSFKKKNYCTCSCCSWRVQTCFFFSCISLDPFLCIFHSSNLFLASIDFYFPF